MVLPPTNPLVGKHGSRRSRMKAIWCTCGMLSILALCASEAAVAQQPLRMDLKPLLQAHSAPAPRPTPAQRAKQRRSFVAPTPQVLERDRRLTDRRESREDVLSTLGVGLLTGLEENDAPASTLPTDGYPNLRFKKRGSLDRDIKRGYRNMGENLAKKVFDDPRGKRIVFDIEGRPGVGVEIPLQQSR
jgi:hypothetical protein